MYIKGSNKMKEQKEMFEEISEVLKVLAHPVRLSLVKIMLAKGPTNVTTMYGDLKCLKVQLVNIYLN